MAAVVCLGEGGASVLSAPDQFTAVTGALRFRDEAEEASSSSRKRSQSLVAESSQAKYRAVATGDQGPSRWAVGVFDKRTGKLTLHDASAFSLRSEPALKAAREALALSRSAKPEQSYLEKQMALAEAFGSKKKQNQLRAKAANVVDVAHVFAADGLTATMESIAGEREEASAAAALAGTTCASADGAASTSAVPVAKKGASTPEKMFDWKAVFGLSELRGALEAQRKALQGFARERARPSWVPDDWARFVATRLRSLERGEENDAAKTCELVLLRHLLLFHSLPMRGSVAPVQLGREKQVPVLVLNRLLEDFSESRKGPSKGISGPTQQYSRPKALRDKLVAHVVLLALKVDGFNLDLDELAQALDYEPKQLIVYAKELGCNITMHKIPGGSAKAKGYKAHLKPAKL